MQGAGCRVWGVGCRVRKGAGRVVGVGMLGWGDLSHGVFVVGGSHSQRARHYIHLIKSPFLIVSIRTSRRRIPASASTNQGPKKNDLIVVGTSPVRTQLWSIVKASGKNLASVPAGDTKLSL